jgi:hypothetical protein
MVFLVWITLTLLSLSSSTWAEDIEKTRHSLIHRPQAASGSETVTEQSATTLTSQSAIGAATTPTAQTRSSAPPQAAATNPQSSSPRLPSSMQRLLQANPALGQLLTPSSPSVTVPPPPTTPPPTSSNGKATLTWTPNKESDLAGYRIYVGTSSGTYNFPGSPFTIGKVTTYILTNLPPRTTYFFALSAYDVAGNESPLSAEVSKSVF